MYLSCRRFLRHKFGNVSVAMAVLTLDFGNFFTRFGNAKFSGQKPWRCRLDTLLPNSGIFHHYWKMARWNSVNSLRLSPDLSIRNNGSVNW